MIIDVQSRGFGLTRALREFVELRMRYLLTRYGDKILRINITLYDVNGPKGGEDKRCVVTIRLAAKQSLVLQETDADMYNAITSCCNRLKRTIGRKLEKNIRIERHKLDMLSAV